MPEAENRNLPLAPANGDAEPRYKIGDVCRIADVQPYVLRYWESEFPALAPDRALTGPRTYSLAELRIIEQIKKLLYDEGYTIAGAKKKLEAEPGGKAAGAPPLEPPKTTKPEPTPPREKSASAARPRGAKPPPEPPSLPLGETAPAPVVTAPIATTKAGEGAPPGGDPRVPKTVAELKEILRILSRRL
jgi:DNA-binding transcriptional MerR regulator